VVITPEFSNELSQYDGSPGGMPAIVSVCSKHAGFVLRFLNRTDCYVWLCQKNLWPVA